MFVVGGASVRWPVVDVGGDGAALPRMAFWLTVDDAVYCVKSYNTLTPTDRNWVG